jgi:hypothetical protein
MAEGPNIHTQTILSLHNNTHSFMLFTFGERKLDLAQYPVPDTVKDALWVLWSTNLGLLLLGCFYVAVDSKQGSKLLL